MKKQHMNLKYAMLQAAYWALYCTCRSFAAPFLQGRGYSNTETGVIMAVGPLLCLFLSTKLAEVIDRRRGNTAFRVNYILYGALLVLNLILIVDRSKGWLVGIIYGIISCLLIAINPINTEISIQAGTLMEPINYGRARGIGSLMYAVASSVAGVITGAAGINLIPILNSILLVLNMFALLLLWRSSGGRSSAEQCRPERENHVPLTLPQFFSRYRKFCFYLAGLSLMFFAHNAVVTFMVNIVQNVGGDLKQLGYINAVMAAMELPAMFLFNRICKRFDCRAVLRFGLVFLALKTVLIFVAGSMTALYVAQIAQAFGFALVVPGMVRYAQLVIPKEDSAKAQSISFMSTTMGNVLASLVCGILIDNMGIRGSLVVLVISAGIGLILAQLTVESSKTENPTEILS